VHSGISLSSGHSSKIPSSGIAGARVPATRRRCLRRRVLEWERLPGPPRTAACLCADSRFRSATLLPSDWSCPEAELEPAGASALRTTSDAATIEVSTRARSSAGRSPGREPV
jgi:hypothetical protein